MSTEDGIYISRRTIRLFQLLLAAGLTGLVAWGAPSLYRYAKIEAM